MKYIEPINVEKAKALAAYLHGKQMRRGREPYVNHLFRVAAQVTEWGLDEDSIVAAILHDSVEDTSATLDMLREFPYQISQKTLTLVDILTHRPQDSYEEYLQRLLDVGENKFGKEVLMIKLADLNDNSTMHPNDSLDCMGWDALNKYTVAKIRIIQRLKSL